MKKFNSKSLGVFVYSKVVLVSFVFVASFAVQVTQAAEGESCTSGERKRFKNAQTEMKGFSKKYVTEKCESALNLTEDTFFGSTVEKAASKVKALQGLQAGSEVIQDSKKKAAFQKCSKIVIDYVDAAKSSSSLACGSKGSSENGKSASSRKNGKPSATDKNEVKAGDGGGAASSEGT